MTLSVQVHRASILLKLLAGFFMVFGYGKLFEPGPPYDDPFGGPDLLPEVAQVAVIPIGLCLFVGMRTYKRIFKDEVGGIGKFGWVMFGASLRESALQAIP